jgi:prephenate dehydratase
MGVVASPLAAQLYGGHVVLEGIEDDAQDETRYLVLAREARSATVAVKTSVVFALPNAPGALHKVLTPFARREVDLAKIESRPLRGRPWEYAFYLDFRGDLEGEAGEALKELQEMAVEVRVLGSYPEAKRNAGIGMAPVGEERTPGTEPEVAKGA